MTVATLERGQDMLVLADRIHTCAPAGTVDALLVRDGRIAGAGAPDVLLAAASRAATLDLRGTTITPGLTDSHAHLTEWAFARRAVDLADTRSPVDAAARVADWINSRDGAPSGTGGAGSRSATQWVRGRGWNPHRWDGEAPHCAILDEQVTDRPAALQSHDMHALWVNSAALRIAGIDADTPDPEGGSIVRDAAGQPTGLLLEWAGRLITERIHAPTLDDAITAMRDAQAELHTLGITGAHSFPGIHLTAPDPLTVLSALHEAGDLTLRILQHLPLDSLEDAIAAGVRSGAGDDWIRTGAVKMFLDGALGSRTAWMREPYENDDSCGMRLMEPGEFRHHVGRAARHGIASTVHAIGDAAVCMALDVLADPAVRVPALPQRIEHVQCCPPDRFGDAAAAGIVCSMQPSHLITDWTIADAHWGCRRAAGTYAFASLLRAGTILAFGSDVPVEPVDPRRGLYAAVMRQDLGRAPAAGWHPAERIGAMDALHGYTVGPARAAGLPAPAGSLAPGAPADFSAWDHDPCADPEAIMSMRCTATVIAGRLVHAG